MGVFLRQGGMKHGGVVGGEHDRNAVSQKAGQRVVLDGGFGGTELGGERAGHEIAGGADLEGDTAVSEQVQEGGIVDGRDAVADAFDGEEFDRFADFIRAAHFAGMDQTAEGAALKKSAKRDRKSTRLNSSHVEISYAVFCLKKKTN